jgi:hypothetical protein
VGIPAAQLPHVWKLFRQADMGPARQHCGAGLGLCLVKGLVEAQGGSVEVVSEQGSGTSFRMRLAGWHAPAAIGCSSKGAAQQQQQAQATAHPAASAEINVLPAAGDMQPRSSYQAAALSLRHSSSSSALAALLATSPSAAGSAADALPSGTRSPKASSSGLGSLSKVMHREKHGRVQVLCVDDDAISQLVVKRLLGPSGKAARCGGVASQLPALSGPQQSCACWSCMRCSAPALAAEILLPRAATACRRCSRHSNLAPSNATSWPSHACQDRHAPAEPAQY